MYKGIHHLAFITNDIDRTIRFYRDLLGFPLVTGIGDARFKHYFFQISPTDTVAFFAYREASAMVRKDHGLPTRAPLGFDHVAIGVESKPALFALKDRLEAAGIEVSPAVDHGLGWSIYFFDPNNIPLELTWQNLEILQPPVLADSHPTAVALEGSAPRPGHWPKVSRPTPPEEWVAYPGAGYELRPLALKEKRVRLAGS